MSKSAIGSASGSLAGLEEGGWGSQTGGYWLAPELLDFSSGRVPLGENDSSSPYSANSNLDVAAPGAPTSLFATYHLTIDQLEARPPDLSGEYFLTTHGFLDLSGKAMHIDTEFYDRFFRPGAYLKTHAEHLQRWH